MNNSDPTVCTEKTSRIIQIYIDETGHSCSDLYTQNDEGTALKWYPQYKLGFWSGPKYIRLRPWRVSSWVQSM